MSIEFEYDFQKVFTTTLNRYVGATDQSGLRGSLPEPTPTDANAIWLAPNGSDANPGTQASPKLTLTSAVAAVTGPKPTIHIFRNGYVGDLIFTNTVDVTITILTNIQVEDGDQATFEFENGKGLIVQHTVQINGIIFEATEQGSVSSDLIKLNVVASDLTVVNCSFIGAGSGLFSVPRAIAGSDITANAPVDVQYCYFYIYIGVTWISTSNSSVSHSIFISNPGTYSGANESFALLEGITTSTLGKTNIDFCYFINYSDYVMDFLFSTQPIAPGHVTNISNCMFLNNEYSFLTNVNTPTLDRHNLNLNYVLDLSNNFMQLTADTTLPANFVVTITNPVDTDTPLKLVDESAVINNDSLTDTRLQYEGKPTPDGSGKYFLDSPLVDAGFLAVGTLIQAIPSTQWQIGSTRPEGIDQQPDGTLWIVDSDQDEIYHTNADGTLIASFLKTAFDAAATDLRGIAYDTLLLRVWLIDSTTKKVYKVTTAGALDTSFSCTIYDAGASVPRDISHDPLTDTLWVCDSALDKIYNIQTNGTLISTFSTTLFAPGAMQISGIAYDTSDSTLWCTDLVSDDTFHIQTNGSLIESFNANAYDTAANTPTGCGMAIDGNLFITDMVTDTAYKVSTGQLASLSPWDESTVLTSTSYNKSLTVDWPPDALHIINNHVNPVNNKDIRGNLETGYDNERRKFDFSFGDNIHVSNLQIKTLRDLVADNGAKKFYPLGIGGNLYNTLGASSGTFSNTDNTVSPTAAISVAMIENHWRGFWITISSNDYYIESNTDLKLYLIDKLNNGFPSNSGVTFTIQFMLINIEKGSYNMSQQNFSHFLNGGEWRENENDAQRYDMTLDSLPLDEVEDERENL